MNDLVHLTQVVDPATGALVIFRPEQALTRDALWDVRIDHDARVGDWSGLDAAVDEKLNHLAALVAWWRGNVRGKGDRSNVADRGHFVAEAEALTHFTKQQISRIGRRLEDRLAYRTAIVAAAQREATNTAIADNHLAGGTGENEWYTPADIIARVREVLGEIDLDPASCAEANETVQAAEFFTEADDGLEQEWHGRVWLNPPYSRSLIGAFVAKLIGEYQARRTTAAILVSHNNTETHWFQSLAAVSSALCFPSMRIKFYRGEDVAAPVNGQAFFYLGEDHAAFARTFESLGIVLACCNESA